MARGACADFEFEFAELRAGLRSVGQRWRTVGVQKDWSQRKRTGPRARGPSQCPLLVDRSRYGREL